MHGRSLLSAILKMLRAQFFLGLLLAASSLLLSFFFLCLSRGKTNGLNVLAPDLTEALSFLFMPVSLERYNISLVSSKVHFQELNGAFFTLKAFKWSWKDWVPLSSLQQGVSGVHCVLWSVNIYCIEEEICQQENIVINKLIALFSKRENNVY